MNAIKPNVKNGGFTLLEMSIVIAIIAIVIGGAVVMRSVVKASQMQAILTEYDGYVKAIKEFQDKYQALPGDFTGAQTIWGSLAAGVCNGSTTVTSITPGTSTCNGNGDGKIGTSDGTTFSNNNVEWFSVWQHLVNAGLIGGQFTGALYSGGGYATAPGYNVPASKYEGGSWAIAYIQQTSAQFLPADQYGNVFIFGNATGSNDPTTAILSPANAFIIDAKVDDGFPDTGIVRAGRAVHCYNYSLSAQPYYNYTIENYCTLVFIPGF